MSICVKCNAQFEVLGDERIVEAMCRACQTEFRIERAKLMHTVGVFTKYHNWWSRRGLWDR